MAFDKRTLVYPPQTQFGERVVVARGDVVLADGVAAEFGFETPGRIFIGERVEVSGPLHAAGDVRVDLFSRVNGDLVTAGAAYLGERVHVAGKLVVEGDLDVGDDVKIEQGFEAHGWINIRNPVPMVVYVFIYLMHLMQMGKSEEVERILQEMEENGGETFAVSENFLYVPEGSSVGLTQSRVRGNLQVGSGARVLGNQEVDGWATIAQAAKLHGALRAGGDVVLEESAEVHGDLVCRGHLVVGKSCHVLGRVEAHRVEIHPNAVVEGEIVAPGGVKFLTAELVAMRDKVESFENAKAPDVLDLLG